MNTPGCRPGVGMATWGYCSSSLIADGKLLAPGHVIAAHNPDTVRLIANTRSSNDAQLAELQEAGFRRRVCRRREGIDSRLDLAERRRTMQATWEASIELECSRHAAMRRANNPLTQDARPICRASNTGVSHMLDFVGCPCSGKTLARLLNPAILRCLARGPAHGYNLLQQLAELKMFASGEPDHAGVYRTLKQMEANGLVRSEWHLGAGPARRVFSLTESGAACLERWLQTLESYRDAIDELLDQTPSCQS